jgi:hypothetical protein
MNRAATWLAPTQGTHPPPVKRSDVMLGDGRDVVTYTVTEFGLETPPDVPLILGDALVNYRAALDHAVWALAERAGLPTAEGKRSQIAFPITTDRAKFPADAARLMPNTNPTAVEIIRRYQPFTNGAQWERHPLYVMNEAVRRDKHRAIQVVAIFAVKLNATIAHGSGAGNFVVHKTEQLDRPENLLPGTQLLRVTGKRLDPDKPNGFVVQWHAPDMVPCLANGYPVETLLNNIDQVVGDLLGELASLLG